MIFKFALLLVGIPFIALSLVITVAILKAGWNIIYKKEPPDLKSIEPKSRYGGK